MQALAMSCYDKAVADRATVVSLLAAGATLLACRWRGAGDKRADAEPLPTRSPSPSPAALVYYVSPHEISRIPWMMLEPDFARQFVRTTDETAHADFVWMHRPTTATAALREKAHVCSLLSGTSVLEDKRNLALLQERMTVPTLESFVCENVHQFRRWCSARFGAGGLRGMWMCKDSGANGGDGLWVLTAANWESVAQSVSAYSDLIPAVSAKPIFVVQKYVERPLLWPDGCKFHFRVYVVLTATMQCYIYRSAFAHVANRPFSSTPTPNSETGSAAFFDSEVHITNCAKNIHDSSSFHRYPSVHLPTAYPGVWASLQALMADVAQAAAPFMAQQHRTADFCHMGVDILADEDETAWLIEANCPPNLFAYTNEPDHPDEVAIRPLIKAMLRDLLTGFVLPAATEGQQQQQQQQQGGPATACRRRRTAAVLGEWEEATAGATVVAKGAARAQAGGGGGGGGDDDDDDDDGAMAAGKQLIGGARSTRPSSRGGGLTAAAAPAAAALNLSRAQCLALNQLAFATFKRRLKRDRCAVFAA